MKLFSDETYDKPLDYDHGLLYHDEDNEINETYDHPIGIHFDLDPEDWYEGIKHFQD